MEPSKEDVVRGALAQAVLELSNLQYLLHYADPSLLEQAATMRAVANRLLSAAQKVSGGDVP